MCGIVGYVGRGRSAQEVLQEGLRRLEYRGYDSAGMAVWDGAALNVRRALGKLSQLDSKLAQAPLEGGAGIGHTRWATHGKPSERNAHPHRAGAVCVVHNGIIENHRELRAEVLAAGRILDSETDTELIAHLVDMQLHAGLDLLAAVRAASKRLVGSWALAAISAAAPDCLVAAKHGGSPLVLGQGDGESLLASDLSAILPITRSMIFMEDGDFAALTEDSIDVVDGAGHLVERQPRQIQWDPVSAEKGGYDHFMQKEIFEQPRAIRDTIGTRIGEDDAEIAFEGVDLSPARVKNIERVVLVACGTAYYAALAGRYWIEQLAGIPCDVELASEYRYRAPITGPGCLLVPVSQSGETADTLAALREGMKRGAPSLGISNTRESSIVRESREVIYTAAGPEIGVASTKCFTAQLTALHLLALALGSARGFLAEAPLREAIGELRRLPRLVEEALQLDDSIAEVARRYFRAPNFLFLGRGIMYPLALEGALKLKEVSYIHAEGYAAGEMKHGPVALVDENMPVVVIANRSRVYEKVVSNLEEVKSRGGRVIAIASQGDDEIAERADAVLRIPQIGEQLAAPLAAVPLQLLAYHIATLKGTDVDQPRNLAKSVTVE